MLTAFTMNQTSLISHRDPGASVHIDQKESIALAAPPPHLLLRACYGGFCGSAGVGKGLRACASCKRQVQQHPQPVGGLIAVRCLHQPSVKAGINLADRRSPGSTLVRPVEDLLQDRIGQHRRQSYSDVVHTCLAS